AASSVDSARRPRGPHPFPPRRSSDLRAIHHADGALDAGLAELRRQRPVAQIQQEGLLRHLLEQGFMAARQWRIERHGLGRAIPRSEEHTSELQSRENLVCRLLLEKKK